jgi:tetratricopeptide (TPR) repeat protein
MRLADPDQAGAARGFATAFRAYGLDVLALAPEVVAGPLRAHRHRAELLAAIEEWARLTPDKAERRRLMGVLEAADPDRQSFRNRWRAAAARRDLPALEGLVAEAQRRDLPSVTWVGLAHDLHGEGAHATAVRLLSEARWRHPNDFWLNFGLASAFAKLAPPQRKEEVVRYYTAALALRPRSPGLLSTLGSTFGAQGRPEEAIRCFHRALDLDPRKAQFHTNLGAALWDQGRVEEATCCYHRALDLDPQYALAHTNLGGALVRQGRLEEAIRCQLRSLQCDPEYPRAHTNLGAALLAQGRRGEALCCSLRALDLDPKNAHAHTNLGAALQELGRAEGAIRSYRKAIEHDPRHALAHNNLGFALHALGRREEAIDCYHKAIEYDPRYRKTHVGLGLAERDRGRFAEALQALRRGLELHPPSDPQRPLVDQFIREAEQLAALERRLPAVLQGQVKPQGAAERVRLAWLCQQPYQRRYAAAARLYAEAFAEVPALAEDARAGHRYSAARAAALAGCGQGNDAAGLKPEDRVGWRRQALTWLRADFAMGKERLGRGRAADRTGVRQELRHWQQDADLAGVRDRAALAGLPAEERAAWQKLWAEVADLLRRAGTAR